MESWSSNEHLTPNCLFLLSTPDGLFTKCLTCFPALSERLHRPEFAFSLASQGRHPRTVVQSGTRPLLQGLLRWPVCPLTDCPPQPGPSSGSAHPSCTGLAVSVLEANRRCLEVRQQSLPFVILLFHPCVSGGLCLFRDDPYGPVFQPNTILFSKHDFL